MRTNNNLLRWVYTPRRFHLPHANEAKETQRPVGRCYHSCTEQAKTTTTTTTIKIKNPNEQNKRTNFLFWWIRREKFNLMMYTVCLGNKLISFFVLFLVSLSSRQQSTIWRCCGGQLDAWIKMRFLHPFSSLLKPKKTKTLHVESLTQLTAHANHYIIHSTADTQVGDKPETAVGNLGYSRTKLFCCCYCYVPRFALANETKSLARNSVWVRRHQYARTPDGRKCFTFIVYSLRLRVVEAKLKSVTLIFF
jgi:hypothetical protein